MATQPKDYANDDSAQFPHGFAMTKKGLCFFKSEDEERIISDPFEVLAQTRDIYSNSWGLLVRWKDDDDVVHQMSIARSMMAGDGRELRAMLVDGGLSISTFPGDRSAFQNCLASTKIDRRARAVSKVGWADDSFALPDRTIEQGGGDLVVYQGTAQLDHEFRERGTLEGWQQGVARFGAGNSRLAISLCAGFVGPLLEAVGAEGGGLHLRGSSSIGKSTALLAAASIWGTPKFVRQWRATSNGLEGVAEQANDCLLLLDEIAQLEPREAGSVAYLLANGSGKSRASQTGEARTAKSWRTFFLSSGEISLAEHARADGRGRKSPAGQEVRILDIDGDGGAGLGLFNTLHDAPNGAALSGIIKREAAAHYGIAGPEFVRCLLGQIDEQAEIVKRGIEKFVQANAPANASGQVVRACHRFGLLAMAGEVAVHFGILPWDQGEATRASSVVFAEWVKARGGVGNAEEKAAIEQVAGFISAHGSSRFAPAEGTSEVVIRDRAGFWRETGLGNREYLIPPGTWKNEVCKGLNVKTVNELLQRKGLIEADDQGKIARLVSISGVGRSRYYILSEDICGAVDA